MTAPKLTPMPDEEHPEVSGVQDPSVDNTVAPSEYYGGNTESMQTGYENGGAAFRISRMRPGGYDEPAWSTGEGRLRPTAIPRSEGRYTAQEVMPGVNLDGAQHGYTLPSYLTDAAALEARQHPGGHPVPFNRGRGNVEPSPPGPWHPDPQGGTNAEGRSIRSSVKRPEDRY